MEANTLMREGRPGEALAALKRAVQGDPADAELRLSLAQAFAVMGEWERCATQLQVAGELSDANLLVANVYRAAVRAELYRRDVFEGRRAPHVMGEPEPWIGEMIRSLGDAARGDHEAAIEARDRAFEEAPTRGGTIEIDNAEPAHFEWLSDGDSRLGPIFELVVEGRYCWVPIDRIEVLHLEAPVSVRDLVWTTGSVRWSNQGEASVLMPTRYPVGAESDESVLMSRRTEWDEPAEGYVVGRGQRMLVTDVDEYPILSVRRLIFGESGG